MEPLPRYKANPAFVGLGKKEPQSFVRGNSPYAPSGPQGSRLVYSERLFDVGARPVQQRGGSSSILNSPIIVSSGEALGNPP